MFIVYVPKQQFTNSSQDVSENNTLLSGQGMQNTYLDELPPFSRTTHHLDIGNRSDLSEALEKSGKEWKRVEKSRIISLDLSDSTFDPTTSVSKQKIKFCNRKKLVLQA